MLQMKRESPPPHTQFIYSVHDLGSGGGSKNSKVLRNITGRAERPYRQIKGIWGMIMGLNKDQGEFSRSEGI